MTIDERLEALVRSAELHAGMLLDHHFEHEQLNAEHARWRADFDLRSAESERKMARLDAYLTRAIRAGVAEARRARKRHKELEQGFVRLEKLLAAFLERGGNGKH